MTAAPALKLSAPAAGPSGVLFRDAAALTLLKRLVEERLLEGLSPGRPLRVWVPECAAGEDAYSVAISLLEAFGSRWREIELCVLFTEPNEDLLARARKGRYSRAAARGIAREKLERYFVLSGDEVAVRPFVKNACRFLPHDHREKPPFHGLDLIACRELLAGMGPARRQSALRLFHSTLTPGGLLLDHTQEAARLPELFLPVGRGKAYSSLKASPKRVTADAASQRDAETELRLVLSKTDEAILVKDVETGLVLEANAAAQRLFGWNLPEFLRLKPGELLAPARAVRRRKAERRSEERLSLPHYRRKNGAVFPGDVSLTFFMHRGRPANLLIVHDAAARLKDQANRKREAHREAFVGDIIHELRSPISIIQGSVETLANGVRDAATRKSFLKSIDKHTARMARLVDRLLDINSADFSKRGGNAAKVPVAEAVWEIASSFIPIAKRRGVSIEIDLPGDLAVLANPADVPHIFANLIDNAVKFSAKGGTVSITGKAQGLEAVVSIRDTGKGISPQELTLVFERFYRCEATKRTKGTGLGLSIVQSLAHANRGSVVAENDPAGGAVFRVTLPLAS